MKVLEKENALCFHIFSFHVHHGWGMGGAAGVGDGVDDFSTWDILWFYRTSKLKT